MENLKAFYYRQDDNGHDYFVPVDEIEEFDSWRELDTTTDEFYDHPGFEHLMFGGWCGDIKLFINPEDLK